MAVSPSRSRPVGPDTSDAGGAGYRLELRLPGLPTMNQKLHWRVEARERAKWREAVSLFAISQGRPPEPLQRARVTMTRHSGSREPDHDNLAFSFKGCLDGLQVPKRPGEVGASVIVDDSPRHVERVYRWEPEKPRKGHIRILVEEIA